MNAEEKHTFDNLIPKITSGNAILFTGAAFSKESINKLGEHLPLANELSYKICEIGSFNKSSDLQYSSSRYLHENENNKEKIEQLLQLLHLTFEVQVPSAYAKQICAAPWNRMFTTNYDNTIEVINSDVLPIDCSYLIDKFEVKDKRCLHINGYIKNLCKDTLENSFKLTETSYLSPEGFIRTPWYTVFKRDLERCSALVFVGYSLYDIDIKRILVEIPDLKNNTYFILNSNISEEDEYRFSQYGIVLKIGVEGFASELANIDFSNKIKHNENIRIKKYQHINTPDNLLDLDIEKLLLFGKINNISLENDTLSNTNKYVVYREKIAIVQSLINEDNIVITSEFGNGKSIFLNECLPILAKNFNQIYLIQDPHSDYIGDIERIITLYPNEKVIFIIDDYFQFISIFEYLAAFNNKNIRFLLFSRSGRHEKQKKKLSDCKFSYKEISIDLLSETEEKNIINLIDSIGFWGKNYPTFNQKKYFVNVQCERQISLLLFNLLESEYIKNKIKDIITHLIKKDDELKQITVVGLYLCMQDLKFDISLLSELSSNEVYNSNIISDSYFNEIFNTKKGVFTSKSSIFCQKVIKNFINPSYTIHILLSIAEKINMFYGRTRSFIYDEILKSCFKFSTIERILPEENKLKNIIYYYENLKRKVPWLINDPHFWLQYAMGYIAFKNFEKAQQYIDNAYGKAKARQNYNIDSINTQQARLYILKSIINSDIIQSFELFKKGHKLLLSLPNSRYKYKQIYLYNKYFEEKKYILIDSKLICKYEKICNSILESLMSAAHSNGSSGAYSRDNSINIIKAILNIVKTI